MFDGLPETWARTTLGEILSLEYGRSLPETSRLPGDVAVYGSNGIVGFHSEAIVKEKGIVVGRKGTAGSVNVTKGQFWPIDTTYYVLPKRELEFGWIAAMLHFLKLGSLNEATGVPGLNRDNAYRQPILLPPLDEQRRIAEVLRSVDEAIRYNREAEQQAYRVLVHSLTDALCLNEVDNQALRPGWRVARIGDLGKVQAGRQRAPSFTNGHSRPYLRVANVFDGYIDTSNVLEMMFTDREYAEYKLLPGDILLNEGQSIELVGRAAIYRGEPTNCCFQNTLVRLRATTVSPDFAHALVRTLYWSGRLSEIATQTTSVAHLGVSRFANLKVVLPPRKEQQRIGKLFDDLCAAVDACRAEGRVLESIKGLVNSDLLSGRVRVPA